MSHFVGQGLKWPFSAVADRRSFVESLAFGKRTRKPMPANAINRSNTGNQNKEVGRRAATAMRLHHRRRKQVRYFLAGPDFGRDFDFTRGTSTGVACLAVCGFGVELLGLVFFGMTFSCCGAATEQPIARIEQVDRRLAHKATAVPAMRGHRQRTKGQRWDSAGSKRGSTTRVTIPKQCTRYLRCGE